MNEFVFIKSLWSGQWLAFNAIPMDSLYDGDDKFFLYFKIPKNGGQISMHTAGMYGKEINSYPNTHYILLLRNLAKQVFGGNPALDVFDRDRADQVPKWIKEKFYKINNKETKLTTNQNLLLIL